MTAPANMEKYRKAVIERGVLPETPLGTDHAPPGEPLDIPLRKSWLDLGGPIREQGSEASCAAYGMLKVLEMEHLRLTGEQINTSERFCYNVSRIVDDIPGDFIEQKGTTLRAAATVLRHYGACDEADWPYKPGEKEHLAASEFLNILEKARKRRIAEYRNLLKDGVNELTLTVIKRALCRRPIACGLLVDDNWLSVGPDGFIVPGNDPFGGHAVALAFYDDELEHDGLDGWFGFINSWSESWGCRGMGYIPYNSFVPSLISSYEIILATGRRREKCLTERRP
jgi:C1A family cysteine protease